MNWGAIAYALLMLVTVAGLIALLMLVIGLVGWLAQKVSDYL